MNIHFIYFCCITISQTKINHSSAHRWVWCEMQGRPGSHRWGSCWWSERSSDSLCGNQPVVTLAQKYNSSMPTWNYFQWKTKCSQSINLTRGEKVGKLWAYVYAWRGQLQSTKDRVWVCACSEASSASHITAFSSRLGGIMTISLSFAVFHSFSLFFSSVH